MSPADASSAASGAGWWAAGMLAPMPASVPVRRLRVTAAAALVPLAALAGCAGLGQPQAHRRPDDLERDRRHHGRPEDGDGDCDELGAELAGDGIVAAAGTEAAQRGRGDIVTSVAIDHGSGDGVEEDFESLLQAERLWEVFGVLHFGDEAKVTGVAA